MDEKLRATKPQATQRILPDKMKHLLEEGHLACVIHQLIQRSVLISAVYTKQKHMERFKAGRERRNGIIQIPDCTDEEAQLRKATEGISPSAVGLERGFRDPNSYYIQETRLGMQTLQEMTSYRACVSCVHS